MITEILMEKSDDKEFQYEDPIERQKRKEREDKMELLEIKRVHNDAINKMIDGIREMEGELRDLDK